MSAPIILVPGFWLGAWAWDTVVGRLRAEGFDVTALTLPGLEPDHPDRASVTLADQIAAIVAAVEAAATPVVLAVHSGAAVPGYAASDRVPERIAHMVYVDTAPGSGPIDPEFADDEYPMPSFEDLHEQGNSVAGLTDDQLATFRSRAVAEPGAALRDVAVLSDNARRAIPSTVICTSYTGEQYREAAQQGYPFASGLVEVTDLTYVELPTGHWPMWSRPDDLAEIIGRVASGVSTA